ncbi:MAG: RNA 2',3'-cyclic phosphodiesterase [Spirochaetes bacterium]|jgi:2'-5' RNA ligase|nr:RNA 2',3'-cyclic phosphodiesterase [Spirochaetota bacterium]
MVASKRLFLAVHLPQHLRDRLAGLQEALAVHDSAVRLVAAENLHLTLHFLGNTEREHIDSLRGAVRRALSGLASFETLARGAGCFPSPRKPRVFWAGVEDPSGELTTIHAALAGELAALDFELDSRAFSPHITIAHAKKRADRGVLVSAAGDLAAAATTQLGRQGTALPVRAVSLVESVLGRGGPAYTDIETVEL